MDSLTNDIFISYRHLDNEPVSGDTGWIDDSYLPLDFAPAGSTAGDSYERHQQTSGTEHVPHDDISLYHTITSHSWSKTRPVRIPDRS